MADTITQELTRQDRIDLERGRIARLQDDWRIFCKMADGPARALAADLTWFSGVPLDGGSSGQQNTWEGLFIKHTAVSRYLTKLSEMRAEILASRALLQALLATGGEE